MITDIPTATLPPGYLLRRMRPSDTARTALLHRRLLPNGLFPRLGNRFVRRWHGTFLDTPSATGLTVVHHGEVVAFVVASLDQRLYLHHTLRRHRFPLMWRGALGLLARPHVLVHFLRTRLRAYARHLVPGLRRRGRSTAAPAAAPVAAPAVAPGVAAGVAGVGAAGAPTRPDARRRVAVVHAVVTSEEARGKGCARALLDTVASAARRARADHIALVTDVEDPSLGLPVSGAAAMYECLGWDRVTVRRHRDGRWIAEYRFRLTDHRSTTDHPLPGTGEDPGLERPA